MAMIGFRKFLVQKDLWGIRRWSFFPVVPTGTDRLKKSKCLANRFATTGV